jgi:Tfp pilus assembly protein PilV
MIIKVISQKVKLVCKSHVSEKGFMLAEILVALFILTIIIIAFTGLFANSFGGIFSAGHKSNALYEAQADMEENIADYDNSGTDSLVIPFSSSITLAGKYITIDKIYTDNSGNSRTVSIITFVSNK